MRGTSSSPAHSSSWNNGLPAAPTSISPVAIDPKTGKTVGGYDNGGDNIGSDRNGPMGPPPAQWPALKGNPAELTIYDYVQRADDPRGIATLKGRKIDDDRLRQCRPRRPSSCLGAGPTQNVVLRGRRTAVHDDDGGSLVSSPPAVRGSASPARTCLVPPTATLASGWNASTRSRYRRTRIYERAASPGKCLARDLHRYLATGRTLSCSWERSSHRP